MPWFDHEGVLMSRLTIIAVNECLGLHIITFAVALQNVLEKNDFFSLSSMIDELHDSAQHAQLYSFWHRYFPRSLTASNFNQHLLLLRGKINNAPELTRRIVDTYLLNIH